MVAAEEEEVELAEAALLEAEAARLATAEEFAVAEAVVTMLLRSDEAAAFLLRLLSILQGLEHCHKAKFAALLFMLWPVSRSVFMLLSCGGCFDGDDVEAAAAVVLLLLLVVVSYYLGSKLVYCKQGL